MRKKDGGQEEDAEYDETVVVALELELLDQKLVGEVLQNGPGGEA